jgi:membrane associated rhomboid family serine protease
MTMRQTSLPARRPARAVWGFAYVFLLLVGVYLIAYGVSEPGGQVWQMAVGGFALGVFGARAVGRRER